MKPLKFLIFSLSITLIAAALNADDAPETTPEGLVKVKSEKIQLAYLLPGATFEGYEKVIVLDTFIAFKKNWIRDQNNGNITNRISSYDMDKAIEEGQQIMHDTFTKTLIQGGYEIASSTAENVMILRVGILNLDIAATDNSRTDAISRSYSNKASSGTLVLEIYDSVTRQLLLRAFDSKSDRASSRALRVSKSSNTAMVNRAFNHWSGLLVEGLDNAKAAVKEHTEATKN